MAKHATPRRLYWDSCIFIDLIKESPYRIGDIKAVLDEVRYNAYSLIFTSILTVTEVAYHVTERDSRTLDPSVLDRLDDLWEDENVIQLIDLNPAVARIARGLIRSAVIKHQTLLPPDAIHLASAIWMRDLKRIEEFNTYDGKLIDLVSDAGLDTEINIPMRKPSIIPFSDTKRSLFDITDTDQQTDST